MEPQRLEALEREMERLRALVGEPPPQEVPVRRDGRRGRGRAVVASSALLALLVAPLALAGPGDGGGDAVEGRAAANGDRVVIG